MTNYIKTVNNSKRHKLLWQEANRPVKWWNMFSVKKALSVTARALAVIAITGILASCMGVGETTRTVVRNLNPVNWFGDDENPKAKEQKPLLKASKPKSTKRSFPKLASVMARPNRPSSETENKSIAEGLAADTKNARYSDQQLRQSSTVFGGRQRPVGNVSRTNVNNNKTAVTFPVRRPYAVKPPQPTMVNKTSPKSTMSSIKKPSEVKAVNVRTAKVRRPAQARMGSNLVAPPVPARPQKASKTLLVGTIYFGDGSAKLRQQDISVIQAVKDVFNQMGGLVRVVGHSSMGARNHDPARRAAVNYKISLRRANAVAKELVRQGIPANDLEVIAKGDREPVYAETSQTGAAHNRRTEIFIEYVERS